MWIMYMLIKKQLIIIIPKSIIEYFLYITIKYNYIIKIIINILKKGSNKFIWEIWKYNTSKNPFYGICSFIFFI